jgi:hypothetical protein
MPVKIRTTDPFRRAVRKAAAHTTDRLVARWLRRLAAAGAPAERRGAEP